jgi:hypothetical protein
MIFIPIIGQIHPMKIPLQNPMTFLMVDDRVDFPWKSNGLSQCPHDILIR